MQFSKRAETERLALSLPDDPNGDCVLDGDPPPRERPNRQSSKAAQMEQGQLDTESSEVPHDDVNEVIIGSRIAVWWHADEIYYKANVMNRRKGQPFFSLHYDDGEEEWLDLKRNPFRFVRGSITRSMAVEFAKHPNPLSTRFHNVRLGTRVALWSRTSREYFDATVTRIRQGNSVKVMYADGDQEWVDLTRSKFKVLEDIVAEEGDIHVLNSSSSGKGSPEHVMKRTKKRSPQKDTTTDHEMPVEEPPPKRKRGRPPKNPLVLLVGVGSRLSIWWEGEQAYFEGVVADMREKKKGFFIKYDDGDQEWVNLRKEKFKILSGAKASAGVQVNGSHADEAGPAKKKRKTASKPVSDSDDDSQDKKPAGAKSMFYRGISIEQIDVITGNVVKVWPSCLGAHKETGITRTNIRRVLKRTGKPYAGGYFWRYKGETHGPWVPETAANHGIEQICEKTGNVVRLFGSLADACKAVKAGDHGFSIYCVCEGLAENAKGHFWRWQGSECAPPALEERSQVIEVRNYSNGNIYKEFDTTRAAAKWIGLPEATVLDLCRRKEGAKGFSWSFSYRRPRKGLED